MLFHGDGLLPQAERYASGKYRRLSRAIRVPDMDYGDALELAAFMGVVGHEAASYVFQWNKRTANDVLRLVDWDEAREYISANLASVEEGDGLSLLRAMREGGWKRRADRLPELIRQDLRAGWDRGISSYEQAKVWPLTRDQIQRLRTPRRTKADERRAAEFASIGLVFV
jgi:hypothetical protein